MIASGVMSGPGIGSVADARDWSSIRPPIRDSRAWRATAVTEGLEAAARAFESLLIGQMLKQMRTTLFGGGLLDSAQTQLYQDLYDQQIAAISERGRWAWAFARRCCVSWRLN
ncbi:MAG: rod-binding protein [Chromatiales bacterium]|nr:rod-binding protein [Chromatiales bacterium]